MVLLNILDFNLFKEDETFYRSFYFMDKDNDIKLSDLMRIDFMELRKLDLENIDRKNKKALWVKFFNAKTKGDLDMIKEIDDTFEKPVEKLKRLSSDPRVLTVFEEEQKRLADEVSRISNAEDRGERKGNLKIAKKLLDMGMSIEDVVKATSLSKEDVENLTKD